MNQFALSLAKEACDTLMRKFEAPMLPPVGHFHYHQGVFLSAMMHTYDLCKEEKYFDYAKAWIDSMIDSEGNITGYHSLESMDDMQPGILLFPIYERTGDERYRKAIETLVKAFDVYPRLACGGLWHKDVCPHQMWLDGLYMGGPLCAMYANLTGETRFYDLPIQQALMMEEKTKDSVTGLWYHAYDDLREMDWADPETGRSPEFWGRSMGWIPVALLDELRYMPADYPGSDELRRIIREMLEALARYQDEKTGLWYQVIDKGDRPDNWLETSCSCLYTAAIARAVRAGILDEKYLDVARRGFEGVAARLERDERGLIVDHVCIGTGVGDYAHYIARPVSQNDLHGVGAFGLMCCAVAECDVETSQGK